MTVPDGVARLRDGYYNSRAYDAATNPGGMDESTDGLFSGLAINVDGLTEDMGAGAEWTGEQVAAAGAAAGVAEGHADRAEAAVRALGSVVELVWDGGTADADPGAGKARLNGLPAAATLLIVSDTDAGGAGIGARVASWGAGSSSIRGDLYLTVPADAGAALHYQVIGAATAGAGYHTVPVAYVGGAAPAAGAAVSIVFDRAGSVGAPGNPGAPGNDGLFTAASAAQAATGTSDLLAITPLALAGLIPALPELTGGQPDPAADLILMYDASGTALRKVRPNNLGVGATNMEAALYPRRGSTGCRVSLLSTATTQFVVADFSASVVEAAQCSFRLPPAWTAGTFSFQVYWEADGGAGSVAFDVRAGAGGDDDALALTLGAAVTVTDTLLAVGDLQISDASGVVTIAGSPAAGDVVVVEVARQVAHASDTLAADARLLWLLLSAGSTTVRVTPAFGAVTKTGRFIRFAAAAVSHTGDCLISAYEIRLFEALNATGTNVALGKTVTVSAGSAASALTDGNTGTEFSTGPQSTLQWITIDLGADASYYVRSVEFRWRDPYGAGHVGAPTLLSVLWSADGTAYTGWTALSPADSTAVQIHNLPEL